MDKEKNQFLIRKYFWLITPYKRIVNFFQKNKWFHSFIIYSYEGNGIDIFVYSLSLWIMCIQPRYIQNCGTCSNCRLMLSNSHPDFFYLNSKKKEKKISLEEIHFFMKKIYFSSHQNRYKIIWFSNIENLKETEISLILRLLDNPPKQTYFLFTCNNPFYLINLFQGKSNLFYLKVPEENKGINWLYKEVNKIKVTYSFLSIKTSLRLSYGAPLSAKKLLYSDRWKKRSLLCKYLYISIKKKICYSYFLY